MPIDRYQNRAAKSDKGMLSLGRLYKGDPKTDPKRPGQDREFFRFEVNPDLANISPDLPDRVKQAWAALYGDKPTSIRNVFLPSDSIDSVFDEWNEAWGKGASGVPTLTRRCTGQVCIFNRVGDTVVRDRQPCVCAATGKWVCKQTGRLHLLLPELITQAGIVGTVMLTTHATTDLDNIRSVLSMMHAQIGRLTGLAFVLHRRKTVLTSPEGAPVTKWVVHLDAGDRTAQQAAQALASGMDELVEGAPALPPLSAPQRPALPSQTPVWDDVPYEEVSAPQIASTARKGVATHIVISDGNRRAYHLKLDSGAKIQLTGFDGLRSLLGHWPTTTDQWKTQPAGTYQLPQRLNVYHTGDGWLFEPADDIPF
jgi:hypothetical protein